MISTSTQLVANSTDVPVTAIETLTERIARLVAESANDTHVQTYRLYTGNKFNSLNRHGLFKCLTAGMYSPTRMYRMYTWTIGHTHSLLDGESFSPSGYCEGGGLYCCTRLGILSKFASDLVGVMKIPDYAHVWVTDGKFKCDYLILENTMNNTEFVMRYLSNEISISQPRSRKLEIEGLASFAREANFAEILRALRNHSKYADDSDSNDDTKDTCQKLFKKILNNHRKQLYYSYDHVLEFSDDPCVSKERSTLYEDVVLFVNDRTSVTEDQIVDKVALLTKTDLNLSIFRVLNSNELSTFDNVNILQAMASVTTVAGFLRACSKRCKNVTARDILLYSRLSEIDWHEFPVPDCKVVKWVLYDLTRNNKYFESVIVQLLERSNDSSFTMNVIEQVVGKMLELGMSHEGIMAIAEQVPDERCLKNMNTVLCRRPLA